MSSTPERDHILILPAQDSSTKMMKGLAKNLYIRSKPTPVWIDTSMLNVVQNSASMHISYSTAVIHAIFVRSQYNNISTV